MTAYNLLNGPGAARTWQRGRGCVSSVLSSPVTLAHTAVRGVCDYAKLRRLGVFLLDGNELGQSGPQSGVLVRAWVRQAIGDAIHVHRLGSDDRRRDFRTAM